MIAPGGAPAPQWEPDPFGRHEVRLRAADGQWTERVRDGALDGIDPPIPAGPRPVAPILDAPVPLAYRSARVPRLLLLAVAAVAVLVVLAVLAVIGVLGS
jgi:hypothetical protein